MTSGTLWWQLPGPSRFLERIVRDLRDGKNAIICLPQHAPSGLSVAVRSALGDNDIFSWRAVEVTGEIEHEPAHFLCRIFDPELPPDSIWNAHALSQSEMFAGKIIWLEGIRAELWPAWKEFLSDYEHACRTRPMFDRTVFCVPIEGNLALDPPRADIALSHHIWRDAVDRLDILLFTSQIMPQHQLSDVQKRLMVAMIANLALWDPFVCQVLINESLEVLTQPAPLLRELAVIRGWDQVSPGYGCWHQGTMGYMEGEEKTHSSLLSLSDPHDELQRRIWSAQVGIMLPFVEEQRQIILAEIACFLRVPFRTRFGEWITDLRDLEIGHIENQIVEQRLPVRSKTKQLVRRLRQARNSLAHLEPLTADLLFF